MAKDREGFSGVWRTIRGAHVFIRDGEDLGSAIKRNETFKKSLADIEEEYKEKRKQKVEERQNAFREMRSARDEYGELSEEFDEKQKEYFKQSDELAELDAQRRLDRHEVTRREMNTMSQEGMKVKPEQLENLKNAGREARAREIDEINSNPRKVVDYYLKKGEFSKADQYMKDYGLEDEKEEFIAGLNSKARADYHAYEVKSAEDRYQSKVFGTDVTIMDKQMKDLFGENFKYDEDKENYNIPKYKNLDEVIADRDSKLNRYINSKTPLEKMTRQQLAEYIVDDQISRGIVKEENRTMQVQGRLKGVGVAKAMSKNELYKGAKDIQLSKMSLSELRNLAKDYGIETKGLSQKQLVAKLISMFNK